MKPNIQRSTWQTALFSSNALGFPTLIRMVLLISSGRQSTGKFALDVAVEPNLVSGLLLNQSTGSSYWKAFISRVCPAHYLQVEKDLACG